MPRQTVLSVTELSRMLCGPVTSLSLSHLSSESRRQTMMDYDTHLKQIVICSVVSGSIMSSGMTMAYPSVAVPALRQDFNSTGRVITDQQAFWIVSLPQISMIIGCLSAGPILDRKGRRFSILLSNLTSAAGWMLIAVVSDLWCMYVGRWLTGFGLGLANPAVMVYVSEVASSDARSALTVINVITFALGITFANLFGYFYRWEWRRVSWMCGVLPTACYLLVWILVPEPQCRVRSGSSSRRSVSYNRPEVIKPLLIITLSLALRQLAGSNSVLSYTVEMMQEVEVTTDPYLVGVLVGVMKTIAGVVSLWVSGRLGRRQPSVLSGLCMVASMAALAHPAFDFPVFAFLGYILSSTVHASTTQAMIAEVFPADVRGTAASVAAVNIFASGFLALFIHQQISFNTSLMFGYYAALSAVSTLFLFLFLPETHGKTLLQIEAIFNKKLLKEEIATKRDTEPEEASPAK